MCSVKYVGEFKSSLITNTKFPLLRDAKEAMNKTNKNDIFGRKIRVEWARFRVLESDEIRLN